MAQYTIQSVDITVENKGKNTWNIANVKYDSKGESKTKKVVSFKNPEVFNTVKALKEGDVVEVSFTPGDEYYNWSGVKVLGGQAAKETPAASAAPTGGRAPTRNQGRTSPQTSDDCQAKLFGTICSSVKGCRRYPS
jgi:hypothetical protein